MSLLLLVAETLSSLIILHLKQNCNQITSKPGIVVTSLIQHAPFLKLCFKTFSFCVAKQSNVKKVS